MSCHVAKDPGDTWPGDISTLESGDTCSNNPVEPVVALINLFEKGVVH
jgi:hypothetical protein